MKLADLAPAFCLWQDVYRGYPGIKPAGGDWGDPAWRTSVWMDARITLAEAQGVAFECPACEPRHLVVVGFAGRGLADHQASQARGGGPSRWSVAGAGLGDLTLAPSIDCGCWHGWIRNGEVTTA